MGGVMQIHGCKMRGRGISSPLPTIYLREGCIGDCRYCTSHSTASVDATANFYLSSLTWSLCIYPSAHTSGVERGQGRIDWEKKDKPQHM